MGVRRKEWKGDINMNQKIMQMQPSASVTLIGKAKEKI